MKRTLCWVLTLGLIISLGIVGCAKKEDKEIKIGVINSLTGSAAPYGANIQNGILMAVDEINKSGGIKGRAIRILIEDDKTSSNDAVSAMNKLVSIEKVPVILGPASSGGVLACAPIANRMKTVLLSSGAASPDITNAGDYIFRNRASGAQEAIITARFAYDKLGLRKIAIFKINTDYGVGFSKYFRQEFTTSGGQVPFEETFNQGDTDFRSQIIKLKKTDVEGVYLVGVPNEVGNILKQAYEIGLKTQFLTNNMESPELLRIARSAAEGLFFAIPVFDITNPEPKSRSFIEKYTKRYGKDPDMLAADSYDAVFLIKEAIERGGYAGEGIKDALYNINKFDGVNGTITFDRNGDVVRPLAIKTVKDGKFIIFQNM